MAAPDYTRRRFPLGVARDRETIIDVGSRINGVVVLQVPAGAGAELHFGAGRDGIPIATGDSWDVAAEGGDGCPIPLDEGLFMSNPIGGGDVILMVSFGSVLGGGLGTV